MKFTKTAGYITISSKAAPTYFWDQYRAQGSGLKETINVAPTQKALQIAQPSDNTLPIRNVDLKTEKIINNEERTIEINLYHVLMSTYSKHSTPAYQEYCKFTSCDLSSGKLIILVKFDEFSRKWTPLAWDSADIDKDFTTNTVEQRLRLK